MSSFLTVTLDTTSPTVSIIAPEYVAKNETFDIIIQADEMLDQWSDIYVVDSKNRQYPLSFLNDGDRFVGEFEVKGMSDYLRIVASVRDEVFNESLNNMKTINIMTGNGLVISDRVSDRNVNRFKEKENKPNVVETNRENKVKEITTTIKSEVIIR